MVLARKCDFKGFVCFTDWEAGFVCFSFALKPREFGATNKSLCLNQQMMILGTDTVHVWCISPYLVEFYDPHLVVV